MNDPEVILYAIGGLVLVFATFVVLSLITEGVRSINEHHKEEEKKKKEEERRKRAA